MKKEHELPQKKSHDFLQKMKQNLRSIGNALPLLHHKHGVNSILNRVLKQGKTHEHHQLPSYSAQVSKKKG